MKRQPSTNRNSSQANENYNELKARKNVQLFADKLLPSRVFFGAIQAADPSTAQLGKSIVAVPNFYLTSLLLFVSGSEIDKKEISWTLLVVGAECLIAIIKLVAAL